jgi:hypothetical protein
MRIAVLGWGSLIWDPRELMLKSTEWHEDGPRLPIEFARISKDGRLTLVTYPGAEPQPTLWAESGLTDLGAARENLRAREGKTCRLNSIHALTRAGGSSEAGLDRATRESVAEWLETRPNLDAAIWTGLSSNWREERCREYSVDDALAYLRSLHGQQRQSAAEYIAKAPQQVQTALRVRAKAEFVAEAE